MPTPQELYDEYERYRAYYAQQRQECGVPSVFEPYWVGHLSALARLHHENIPPELSDWIKDPLLQRFFSPENIYRRMTEEIRACQSCVLSGHRNNTVPGKGPLRTDLMVVGEAPGADEDACGEPFVGRAGKALFDDLFPKWMGRTRETIFIANTLKCRPPGNRDPEPAEIQACHHFLHRQIFLVNPKLILAAGKHAGRWLTGDPVNKMADVHGKTFWYAHIPVMVMPHPAAYLRNKEQWGKDIYDVMQWAKWILDQPYDSDYWSK